MGLNLSQGFAQLGQGLGAMAQDQAHTEDENIQALRQENLLRLQDQLGTKRDELNHTQAIELANKTADRQEAHDANMLIRSGDIMDRQDKRQGAREAAAEQRANDRDATMLERDTRNAQARGTQDASRERASAAQELLRIKQQIEATRKGAVAANPMMRNMDAMTMAEKNPDLNSLFYDLKRADERYRAADQELTGGGQPRDFSRENGGSSTDLIPTDPSGF